VTSPSDDRRKAAAVLGLSGVAGFVTVAFAFPDWQVAVETAQVVAGLVHYPIQNPFYIYHAQLWTVLHQICAVLLLAGLSEITLSTLISGLQGMLTFQALAMFVYAFSRSALLSVAAVPLVLVSRAAEFWVTYPIFLLGTSHTYGALGLSLVVLVAALIGCGWYRSGLFLLGLAPAVHPSLGAWLALAAVLCLLWDFRTLRVELRPAWTFFAAGCGASALSLGVHLLLTHDAPPVDPRLSAQYLAAFTAFWDGHRQPVDLASVGIALNVGALALAAVWLTFFRADLPGASRFLLRFVAVTAVVSIAFAWLSWVPPSHLPATFVVLMPTRLLNVNIMTFAALLLGVIGAYGATMPGRVLALLFTAALLAGRRSILWEALEGRGLIGAHPRIDPAGVMAIAAAAAVVVALLAGRNAFRWRREAPAPRLEGPEVPRFNAPFVALTAASVMAALVALDFADRRASVFRDRTNDALFGHAARGRGLLLTGGELHLIQLRTRRPVLLDGGGLDGLAYALEAGPEMDRILRNVYAIDLFNPPPSARGSGVVPPEENRAAWERYSRERWREIRRGYKVTQVLTPGNWLLDLPIVAQSRQFLLYEIPE
jgi:hypothetical protein